MLLTVERAPVKCSHIAKVSFLDSQEPALVLIFMWLEYLEMLSAEGT